MENDSLYDKCGWKGPHQSFQAPRGSNASGNSARDVLITLLVRKPDAEGSDVPSEQMHVAIVHSNSSDAIVSTNYTVQQCTDSYAMQIQNVISQLNALGPQRVNAPTGTLLREGQFEHDGTLFELKPVPVPIQFGENDED